MTQSTGPVNPGPGVMPPMGPRPRKKKTHPGVIVLFAAVALAAVLVGSYFYFSSEKTEGPSSSASSEDIGVREAGAVTSVQTSAEESARASSSKDAKEASTEKPVDVEDVPVDVDNSRQCRDDVTIADCRAVTAEELNKCGFCKDSACTNGQSSVRLACESLAIIQYAQMVAEAGKGVVNLCECQTQRVSAPSASE